MVEASEVFGLRTRVSEYSYVNRGALDEKLSNLSRRDQHIALSGESRSGKSWLRQKVFPTANIVQCRINWSRQDVYNQALSNLGYTIAVEKSSGKSTNVSGSVGAEGGFFSAKVRGDGALSHEERSDVIERYIGRNECDLNFVANVIKLSGRRLVIEDFHYMSTNGQQDLAHDLKSLWDYEVFVVIVGVWSRANFLTTLNSELSGRIHEQRIGWTQSELELSFQKGCRALNLEVDNRVVSLAAKDSYFNIGNLQAIALNFVQNLTRGQLKGSGQAASENDHYQDACMEYAEQLEAKYTRFAEKVSEGIRIRKDSTRIYAHALWAIMEASDDDLIKGLSLDWIYQRARSRQSRIIKPNLRSALKNLKQIQKEGVGRDVIISFDEVANTVELVDRSILFFRKYSTLRWPWEEMASTG